MLGGIILPNISYAELGGGISTVYQEQKQFNSQTSSSALGNVTVITQRLPSGIILREYMAGDGLIFALTWQGPSQPNLQVILGAYFDNYLNAAKNAQRPIYSQDSNIVIESSGMMGAYEGLAYLPRQLPVGFSVKNLQ